VHKSLAVGHIPDIIRLGREINDGMARHAATRLVKALIHRDRPVRGARVLVLGLTFKEDCADIRNTKVIDLIRAFGEFEMDVDCLDPHADAGAVAAELGLAPLAALPERGDYDALVLAVAQADFLALGPARLRALLAPGGVLFDMKSAFPREASDLRL
jgi:UDP-N-acetyl-D-galactosamine dehydrogenase